MGAVYEVIDVKTHRHRALKLMLPSLVTDEDMRARFKLEATVTAHIESEHIVETFDADVDPETGAPFLVMELLRGNDLADILTERSRLAAPEVILILAQAARALDKTHAAGIVHRDLKPENLFITHRDDGSVRVKILDFGIAKVVAASEGPQKKQQTINLGTPPYMSPEQILGDATIDHRADLYAIAHIAYALLVGEPYWLEESRNGDTLYRLLLRMVDGAKEPPTVRAQRYGMTLPQEFDAWFLRATAKNPSERFDRASELVFALAHVLGVPLQQRSPRASIPEGDWELDSISLTKTATNRLVSVQPEVLMSSSTPLAPVVGPVSVPSIDGFGTPNPSVPVPVPSIPPLASIAPTNPTPLGTHVEVTPAPPSKPDRRAMWVLMAVALVFGFVGVLVVSGPLVSDPNANGRPSASNTAPTTTQSTLAVADIVDAGLPDATEQIPREVLAISASPSASGPAPLPSGSASSKPVSTAKPKNSSTKKTGPHDPLKTL